MAYHDNTFWYIQSIVQTQGVQSAQHQGQSETFGGDCLPQRGAQENNYFHCISVY